MPYLSKSSFVKRKQSPLSSLNKLIVGIVAIVAVLSWAAPNLLAPVFTKLAMPIWRSEKSGVIATISSLFTSKEKILDENRELKEDLAKARAGSDARAASLADSSLVAPVLSKPPVSPYDTIIIDAGKGSVSPGDLVTTEKGFVMGEVKFVFDTTARVDLYSSPGTNLSVLIDGTIPATAIGVGGQNYNISLPRDVAVRTGAPVTLQGSGRILGAVGAQEVQQEETFRELLVESPFNINDVEYVVVANH